MTAKYYVFLFLGLTILVAGTVALFRLRWTTHSRVRSLCIKLSTSVFAVGYAFLIFDFIFSLVVVESDGLGFTLSHQRWRMKYWKPVNSQGYRDYEHDADSLSGKQVLIVVGDSIVAGHGIDHITDRFPNVLGAKLKDRWEVIILAQNGWNLMMEYQALSEYLHKPDRLIVSYHPNDIERAARRNGFTRPEVIQKPSGIMRVPVERSAILNRLYWRFYRGSSGNAYWDYLRACYDDPEIWRTHEAELLAFIEYAEQNGTDLAFLIWPQLRDLEGSRRFASKVTGFLHSRNVEAIDLTRYLMGRKPEDLIVNITDDAHPNKAIHAEVAGLLRKQLVPWD